MVSLDQIFIPLKVKLDFDSVNSEKEVCDRVRLLISTLLIESQKNPPLSTAGIYLIANIATQAICAEFCARKEI